ILTCLTELDHDLGMGTLAVGCYAAGACLTVCVSVRSVARHTRRAFYRQRRWDDGPDAAVLHLLRGSDAVDCPPQRTVASRSRPQASPLVPHVQHPNGS